MNHQPVNGVHSFCSVCGANLITKFSRFPEVYGFALGTLDTDPGIKARLNAMSLRDIKHHGMKLLITFLKLKTSVMGTSIN